MRKHRWIFAVFVLMGMAAIFPGCRREVRTTPSPSEITVKKMPHPLGYTVQVGAFAQLDNAVKLTMSLIENDLFAFYFQHESGLYKVRFGDFSSKDQAFTLAEEFRSQGLIQEFFIVSPVYKSFEKTPEIGFSKIREKIMERARRYIGIPYKWGGTSPDEGFDCSGLTRAVYQLEGLDLPRTSKAQFSSGTAVRLKDIKRGDLVFFSSPGRGDISHVGIYVGDNKFIHAPGRDQTIRIDSLSTSYFQRCFQGARTYFQ
ncbi:MAG: C40 family peptidase [Candidatus Aminicenantes bacterium]|nr:C40 family peptidase [Candidatus Aminicenantes bacterium]